MQGRGLLGAERRPPGGCFGLLSISGVVEASCLSLAVLYARDIGLMSPIAAFLFASVMMMVHSFELQLERTYWDTQERRYRNAGYGAAPGSSVWYVRATFL